MLYRLLLYRLFLTGLLSFAVSLIGMQETGKAQRKKSVTNSPERSSSNAGAQPTRNRDGVLKAYLLKHIESKKTSEVIMQMGRQLFSPRHVTREMPNRNGLLFFGSLDDHKKLAELLESIDVNGANREAGKILKVITMQAGDVGTLSDTLANMFAQRDDQLRVRHNSRLSQIYLYGETDAVTIAEALLKRLDESAIQNADSEKKARQTSQEILLSISLVVDASQIHGDQMSQVSAPDVSTQQTIDKAKRRVCLE